MRSYRKEWHDLPSGWGGPSQDIPKTLEKESYILFLLIFWIKANCFQSKHYLIVFNLKCESQIRANNALAIQFNYYPLSLLYIDICNFLHMLFPLLNSLHKHELYMNVFMLSKSYICKHCDCNWYDLYRHKILWMAATQGCKKIVTVWPAVTRKDCWN